MTEKNNSYLQEGYILTTLQSLSLKKKSLFLLFYELFRLAALSLCFLINNNSKKRENNQFCGFKTLRECIFIIPHFIQASSLISAVCIKLLESINCLAFHQHLLFFLFIQQFLILNFTQYKA